MQLIKKVLLIPCLCLAHFLHAQDTTAASKYKQELGLNVTNLITDLLGNNNRTDAGIYLLTYKYVKGAKAIRIGANIGFSAIKQDNFGNEKTLNNQNFQLRIGQETRHQLSPKFQYYFGLDGILGYKLEESFAVTNSNLLTQKDKTFSIGTGPVLGFQFALYDRLLIGTEGSFYAVFNYNTVTFSEAFSGSNPIPDRKNQGVNAQTNLPKFLFLILKF